MAKLLLNLYHVYITAMKLFRYIFLFCSNVLVISCSTDEHTAKLIDRAERIVEERPDSALTIMRSVNPSTVYGDEDLAHYCLVYSEALYHNGIDSDCDSLTRPMFDYYMDSDNHSERARAMYQHALVMCNGGKRAEAMYSLLEAEESLEYCDNPHLAGLVHNKKGEIYGLECLFTNALEEYTKSAEYYAETELQYHKTSVIYDIGYVHKQLQEYDRAEMLLTQAVQECIEYGFMQLLEYPLWRLAETYIETNNFEKCNEMAHLFEKYGCQTFEQNYYYLLAIIEANLMNMDKALEYLNIAQGYPSDYYTDQLYLTHLVYKLLGDSEQALYYYTLSKKEQDELFLNVIDMPILVAQLDALSSKFESERQQTENSKLRYVIAIVSTLFVSLSLIGYLRYRNMRQKRKIAEYMSVIAELQQSINETSSTPHYEQYVHEDFTELNKLCEVLYTFGDTPDVTRRIASSVTKSIDSLKNNQTRIQDLERMVNQRYGNVVAMLKERCPKLNAKESRYVLYNLLGFSSRSICVLLDVDSASLSRLKYKLKNKLIETNCENLCKQIFEVRWLSKR